MCCRRDGSRISSPCALNTLLSPEYVYRKQFLVSLQQENCNL